jgi:hypothetical protein
MFQRDQGLDVDGKVGPHTWGALERALSHIGSPAESAEVQLDTRHEGSLEVRTLQSLYFWINAFIPTSVGEPMEDGPMAGSYVIEMPPAFGYALTDDRGFDDSPLASARIHVGVELTFEFGECQQSPPSIRCGETVMFRDCSLRGVLPNGPECLDADSRWVEAGRATAVPRNVSCGTPEKTAEGRWRMSVAGAASIPTIPLAPDIDFNGRLTVDTVAGTCTFDGEVDEFPAFEAYVMFDGGAAVCLFQVDPDTPAGLVGDACRAVYAEVPFPSGLDLQN